jgi:hypothetical protein
MQTAEVFGMPPLTFIVFLFVLVMFFGMMVIFMVRQSIKKAITGGVIALFITKDKKIEFHILPIEAGVIKAPPHHRFVDGQERIYFVNRRFSLSGQFPPFIWNIFQETGQFGIWEEGDSQPILPSDEPSFVTPEMISSLINQNVIALIVKRIEEQFGKLKGSLGVFPWYFWAILIAILLLTLIDTWIDINNLNIQQYILNYIAPPLQ